MTQQDPNEASNVVQMPSAALAPQQPAKAPQTEGELWAAICVRASQHLRRLGFAMDVRFGTFPIGHMFVFWKGEEPGKNTVIARGSPVPQQPQLNAFALFQDDDCVRVYALPAADSKNLVPTRLTYSKTAPVPSMFVEYMTLEVFEMHVALEIVDAVLPEEEEDDTDE